MVPSGESALGVYLAVNSDRPKEVDLKRNSRLPARTASGLPSHPSEFLFPLKAEPPLWPEGNVTFGYLSALNTRVKTFNFSNNAEPLCLVHFATLALRAGSAVSR